MTLGKLEDSWVLASETCALDLMEAKIVRDIEPGETVVVDDSGLQSFKPFRPQDKLQCVFEYVYFARPDSVLWGRNVHVVRKALGRAGAGASRGEDLVISVPDSGVGAGGLRRGSRLAYDSGLVATTKSGEPSSSQAGTGITASSQATRTAWCWNAIRVVIVDD